MTKIKISEHKDKIADAKTRYAKNMETLVHLTKVVESMGVDETLGVIAITKDYLKALEIELAYLDGLIEGMEKHLEDL